ncbi:MAG TPA: hypothetical protein VE088_00620 [Gaiellaceae bacterium]|jgi:hypothetical protein|nr:hypothetical protein [Gaiellaceae bacterium]
MEERYPIGATESCVVAVWRLGDTPGYGAWAATIGLRSAEATIRVPGQYAGVLGQRLRTAAERFSPGARLARDEFLDVTAVAAGGEETLALSSTARSPVRVTVEVPREEVEGLAELLEAAQALIETLRQGLGLVPDSLPEAL